MIVLSACYSHSGSCCPLATSSVIIIITIMTINIVILANTAKYYSFDKFLRGIPIE